MSKELLRVDIESGKYTIVRDAAGRLTALRYGEPWRDCCGDGMILALAYEVLNLRETLASITEGDN
jgi:hypothetical protein